MSTDMQSGAIVREAKRTQRIRNSSVETLSEPRRHFIEVCARLAMPLGLSRSGGEIFGLIFSSTEPVSFDDVISQLGLSTGSASQGLKLLRRMGALRITFVAGDRRNFYEAESSLKKLLTGYMGEVFAFQLAGLSERLLELEASLQIETSTESQDLKSKVDLLLDWNRQLRSAMNAAMAVLK